MSERRRFVGLDVHAATIAVAVAEEGGSVEDRGSVPNAPAAVRRLMGRLDEPGIRLTVAYEAAPTGYALCRQLCGMGIECMVVAPSLIPCTPGDRVKTDRRDALKLARLLRGGYLTAVWVPDEAHEALRNLLRWRADAKAKELRARHRLSKFLLRQGMRSPAGVKPWSLKHETWLNQVRFEQASDPVVFEDYRAVVRVATERVRRLEAALLQSATTSPQVRMIAALQTLHGVGVFSAITIVTEVGDLRSFGSARQLMAYTGLVPSEYSSGVSCHRGYITKTGNAHLPHVLGEAAHHVRHAPSPRSAARARRRGVPVELADIAWRAHQRLHDRYRQLAGGIGRTRVLTAVARELAGFVCALKQQLEQPAKEGQAACSLGVGAGRGRVRQSVREPSC